VNKRTHRKILVVDGLVGFTGGVGIAEEWEGDARDPSEWRDDHFRIRGPAVRHLQGAFAEDWRDATGEVLMGRCVFPPLETMGSARILPLVTSPGGRPSPVSFLYWLALQVASDRVDIATPTFCRTTT
jgi:cardiolipin synthase A/B